MKLYEINEKLYNKLEGLRSYIYKELQANQDIQKQLLTSNPINKAFIAGGAITSLFLNEEPKDYDIYFTKYDALVDIIKFYINKFNKLYGTNIGVNMSGNEVGLENLPDISLKDFDRVAEEFEPIYISENAITLQGGYQIIYRFYGEEKEVSEKFDFEHCKGTYSILGGLNVTKDMLQAILTKELIYTNSYYPLSSLLRMKKYMERGWNISSSNILKIVSDLNNLDLYNPQTLQAQLIGVDLMYLEEFADLLENKKAEGTTWFEKIIEKFTDIL